MQRLYDYLLTDKEPFQYIEKAVVCMKDGFLSALRGKEGIDIISPSGTLLLVLGAGTSITQEAAIFMAQHDMLLCFGRGGSNLHSILMSGRYQNPQSIVNQVLYVQENRLDLAKRLLMFRLKIIGDLNDNYIEEINILQDIESLLLWEARWSKQLYRRYATKNKIEFRREYNGKDYVNERLNILNNAFYSICAAIAISTGISPSVAIIHGTTRRGGLSFDLADIYKTKLIFDLAFSKEKYTTKEIMYLFANKLRENNQEIIKNLLAFCLFLSGDSKYKIEEILKI